MPDTSLPSSRECHLFSDIQFREPTALAAGLTASQEGTAADVLPVGTLRMSADGLCEKGNPAAAEPHASEASRHLSGDQTTGAGSVVLELRVRNHPGTMSHITGLFARRGFNLEAILCVPNVDRATSKVRLLVSDQPRLDQVERQLTKLYDVLEVRHRTDLTAEHFGRWWES